jgi:hypothetical protein
MRKKPKFFYHLHPNIGRVGNELSQHLAIKAPDGGAGEKEVNETGIGTGTKNDLHAAEKRRENDLIEIIHGDAFEGMGRMDARSIDLAVVDPPYNIGIAEWDKIPDYPAFTRKWLSAVTRCLKSNGVLYVFSSDMRFCARLIEHASEFNLEFVSFLVWYKTSAYRTYSWKGRDTQGKTALRSWFNVCEWCVHLAVMDSGSRSATGLEMINSNPECYRPVKDWYKKELGRLNLTEKDIAERYTLVTGKKPHMLKHYFHNSQFSIPTKEVWDAVYKPLGFALEYEDLWKEYEEMRKGYEGMRYYHKVPTDAQLVMM